MAAFILICPLVTTSGLDAQRSGEEEREKRKKEKSELIDLQGTFEFDSLAWTLPKHQPPQEGTSGVCKRMQTGSSDAGVKVIRVHAVRKTAVWSRQR